MSARAAFDVLLLPPPDVVQVEQTTDRSLLEIYLAVECDLLEQNARTVHSLATLERLMSLVCSRLDAQETTLTRLINILGEGRE